MSAAAATSKPKRREPTHKETEKDKERVDEQLDDALEDTFPASDPPAMTEPSPPRRKRHDS